MMAPAVHGQIARSSGRPFGSALAFVPVAGTLLLAAVSSLAVQRRSAAPVAN